MNHQIRQIAVRLQELRNILGFSTEELANACHLSAEEYRLIESGEVDIPVSILQKVAHYYDISLEALMFKQDSSSSSYFLTRAGTGPHSERTQAYLYESLASGFTSRKTDPFLVTVPPQTGLEPVRFNSHSGEEFNYILSGKMQLMINGDILILSPGDSIYFNSKLPHAMQALDSKPVRFLSIIIQ